MGVRLRAHPDLRYLSAELHRISRGFERNLTELQDGITARRRDELIGSVLEVRSGRQTTTYLLRVEQAYKGADVEISVPTTATCDSFPAFSSAATAPSADGSLIADSSELPVRWG